MGHNVSWVRSVGCRQPAVLGLGLFGAGLLGCGSAASSANDSAAAEEEALAPQGTFTAVVAQPAAGGVPADPAELAAQCAPSFAACGGLLAGEWTVQGSCEGETRDSNLLQAWMSRNLELQQEACVEAPQRLISHWSGRLRFDAGVLNDELQRADQVQMSLGLDCIRATFGVDVRPAQLERVCEQLTDESMSCTAAGGACSCTLEQRAPIGSASIYGVLGTSVALSGRNAGEAATFIDYCVQGDVLHWNDPESGQHLVLQRQLGPKQSQEPGHIR
jgi:hypothetical protein